MSDKHSVEQSLAAYQQAEHLIPGKTQLISRRSSQFAHGTSPIYAQRAKGSRFIDIDENEYIDWVNAVGAIILGHADDVVDTAVKAQIDRGSIYTLNSTLEIELAELLNAVIPSSEMVRYTRGGGEANAVCGTHRTWRDRTGCDSVQWLSWLARLVSIGEFWC